MRVSEQQRSNAAKRSVEARKKAKLAPTVVNWDKAIASWLVMMDEVYHPKPARRRHVKKG
jgi:hypothetical protein